MATTQDPYLRTLKRFAIDGVVLPYKRISIRGGVRHVEHEYPHVDGGLAEKLGRKLYEIDVDLVIDEGVARAGFYQGRNLIADFNTLSTNVLEKAKTVTVYLPNIGEIKAFAPDWTREIDVAKTSGEAVRLTLKEDNDSAALIAKTLSIKPPAAVTQFLGALESASPVPMPNPLQQIRDAVNQLLAFRDQGQMWVGFIDAKIQGLQAMFEEVDATLDYLNDPEQWLLLESLRNLWSAVRELGEDIGAVQPLGTWTVPRLMSCADISIALYRDTGHAIDILNLNALEDPYAVPAGTSVRYFKAA